MGPSDKLPIYLDRVKRGDDPAIWLFSEETLRQIPDAYQNMGEVAPVGQNLPGWLQTQFLATPLWRWLLLLVALVVLMLLGSWINRLVQPVLRKIAHRVAGPAAVEHVSSIRAPLRLLFFGIVLLVFGVTSDSLLGRAFWHNIGSIVTVIAVTWLATRTMGLISELLVGRLKRVQSSDKIALTGLIGRLSLHRRNHDRRACSSAPARHQSHRRSHRPRHRRFGRRLRRAEDARKISSAGS